MVRLGEPRARRLTLPIALALLLPVMVGVFVFVVHWRTAERGRASENGEVDGIGEGGPSENGSGSNPSADLDPLRRAPPAATEATVGAGQANRSSPRDGAAGGDAMAVSTLANLPPDTSAGDAGARPEGGAPPVARNDSSPFKEVESVVSPMRSSGPTDAEWSKQAHQLLEALPDLMDADFLPSVEFSDVECYAAGCFVRMRYANMESFRRVTEKMLRDPQQTINSWSGPRQRITPKKQANGQVVSGWILKPN